MRDMIEEMVDELLDMDGTIEIAGSVFSRSAILRELDPTAYRMLCCDTADALIEDLKSELDYLGEDGDIDEVQDLKDRINELENI
jgi:hypothetical protein